MEKKGQITAFIIVGIIVIFSAALFFYLRERTTVFTPKELIPKELTPVKSLIEQCTKTLTQEAADLASSQGGYVTLPNYIYDNPNNYAGPKFEGPLFKIPLWYVPGQIFMPELENIQDQIAIYVLKNLPACIDNFSSFKDQYDITELAKPTAKVVINDKQVITNLIYPLEIKNKQSTEVSKISEFSSEIQDSLGRKYRLASQIFIQEQRYAFLENLTRQMIYSSELPTEGMEINCNDRSWDIKKDIIPQLRLIILANLRFLTITNTDDLQPESQFPDYYSQFYKIKVSNEKFHGLSVTPIFDSSSEMKVDVYPNSNGVVKPATADLPILGNCFKIYNHKYDVNYPLVFQIRDDSTDEPSFFYFGTAVVLDKSNPNRYGKIKRYVSLSNDITNSDFCDDAKYSMTVFAVDEEGNELENASIRYQCIDFVCDMGKTSIRKNEYGNYIGANNYALTTKFPSCAGGVLIAQKDGYVKGVKDGVIVGDVEINGQKPFVNGMHTDIKMASLKKMEVNVKEIVIYPNSGGTMYDTRDLSNNVTAIITLKAQGDTDYETTTIYPPEPDYEFTQDLMLIKSDDGYDLDIKLTKGENWIGGSTLSWTPGYDNVNENSKVTFYVIRILGDPSTEEDFVTLYNFVRDESVNHPPVFENS